MSRAVKLTKTDRDDIIDSLVSSSKNLKLKRDKMNQKLYKLALDIRDHTLGKYKEVYTTLPKKIQNRANYIRVAGSVPGVQSTWNNMYFNVKCEQEACPVGVVRYAELPTKLQTRVRTTLETDEKIDAEKRKIRGDLRRIVYSCSTEKQLSDTLPEAKKHYGLALRSKLQGNTTIMVIPKDQIKAVQKALG